MRKAVVINPRRTIRRCALIILVPAIGHPLVDIAAHIVQTEGVRLSALKKQTWSAEIQVDVLVRNGVVDLWGTVRSLNGNYPRTITITRQQLAGGENAARLNLAPL